MRTILIVLAIAIVNTIGATGFADVLELKDGQVLTGKYAGGTATTVNM
ncbi:MAG: hypothetical protein H7Z14_16625, partial [Anaerolineae bacterium]|nr:hypothetical protein [Phycisphaerae bacterium]